MLFAGIGAVSGLGSQMMQVVEAYAAAPSALISSPVTDQIEWFVGAVNSGGASLSEAEIAEHVSPELLAAVPPAQIIGLVQSLAAGFGELTLQGTTRPQTETQAVALVSASAGIQVALPVSIETAAPHRITGLGLFPSPTADGTPIEPVSSKLESQTGSGLVDIGGRALYLTDSGSGGPTVVLEAGLTDSGATWSGIIPAIAAEARVVSYDRANATAGASDRAETPRSASDAVDDLHELLTAAEIPGPYVLAGHSVGGLFVQLFASRFPDEVAGLVLVDSTHEEQEVRRQEIVSAELFAIEQQAIQASNSEGIDMVASFEQMRAAREETPLQPMPMVVLSAAAPEPATYPAGWPMDAEMALHAELQADLASLVPNARLVIAEGSGHYVQQARPDLVVAAIQDVVRAAVDPSTWGV